MSAFHVSRWCLSVRVQEAHQRLWTICVDLSRILGAGYCVSSIVYFYFLPTHRRVNLEDSNAAASREASSDEYDEPDDEYISPDEEDDDDDYDDDDDPE